MLLKELTDLNGVAGNEDEVREYIKKHISQYTDDIKVDSMGNLIAYKKGNTSNLKVMLAAHMDEVGLMVTGYTENGFLKFSTVGAIDERILLGKRVVIGDKKIPGVIGAKPIHMQEAQERNTNVKAKKMCIDIGVGKKEEAERITEIGDYISFYSEYVDIGECIKAKALDDRVGCIVLMEALKESFDFDLYACFTVQEEIGLRGAQIAAYTVKPDLALIIEGTTCSDVPEVEKYDYSTKLGYGPAVTVMDRTSYSDKKFVNYILKIAKDNNYKIQFKQSITGGNDAGSIQRTCSGAKVAVISVPCRYIHSPVSLLNKEDFKICKDVVLKVLKEISNDKGANI